MGPLILNFHPSTGAYTLRVKRGEADPKVSRMNNRKAVQRRSYLKHSAERYAKKQARRHRYKEKEKATGILWRAKNKEKIAKYRRARELKLTYGITVTEYDALFAKQNGVCAICWRRPEQRGTRRFAVDHNHKTGEIRGLLCSPCNVSLGHFKDDWTIAFRAMSYLRDGNS